MNCKEKVEDANKTVKTLYECHNNDLQFHLPYRTVVSKFLRFLMKHRGEPPSYD